MEQRITVAVRIRPPLDKERFLPLCTYKMDDGQTVIIKSEDSCSAPVAFRFDDVFDGNDDQRDVYEGAVQEVVDLSLQGVNTTVLTYGQTGSGKTYTILGSMSNWELTEQSVELYIDEVKDLLAQRKKIKLRETPEETLTPGVNIVEVLTMKDVFNTFNMANAYRSVSSTKMNDSSSRSHALFFIDIFQVPTKRCHQSPEREQLIDANGVPITGLIDGLVRSRIALVDLAGSERVKRSGVEGQTMVEAQFINKSLSALGTTINAMHTESSHIPFRESKLTRLLKHSFADRGSRLLLIGQVAPPSDSAPESQGTLRFCDRVKGLKAGRVTAFRDPEEEERFLQSLRQQEEITAELRIAGVEYFYKPQRPAFIARMKNMSVDQALRLSIATLEREGTGIVARREAECMREMEEEEKKKMKMMVHAFADKMNHMIDEYEAESRAVKKEKKEAKRLKEEVKARQEEELMNAKKAKKYRLKLQARVEELSIALQEMGKMRGEIDEACEAPFPEDTDDDKVELSDEEKAHDRSVQLLVESFYSHTKELNAVHHLYVQWLAATLRQRSQVRRAKLLSSAIIMEGTTVDDIIDFMIDRAVNIAEGVIKPTQNYTWNDIDGFSCALRSGDHLYPPFVTAAKNSAEACEPSEYHNITFLSSDESDEENSHHREKNRTFYVDSIAALDERQNRSRETAGPSLKEQKGNLRDTNEQGELKQTNGNRQAEAEDIENKFSMQAEDEKVTNIHDNHDLYSDREEDEEGENGVDNVHQGAEYNTRGEATKPNEQSERKTKTRDHEYLMRVYDSPTLVQDLIKFLRSGSVMLKHGRVGKPHRRHFWVSISQNSRRLVWTEVDSKVTSERSSIDLSDVSFLQLGCFSKVFKRHPVSSTDPSFYRSFTLGLKGSGRTIDIVADTLPDFEAWIVGLSNLVRVDPVWGGKLDITKEMQFEYLNCFEASLCESNYIYPLQYIMLKKRVKQIAARTLATLEQCGNDAEKAHKILRGIHPPAVNEHGAVYLTKGELRFISQGEMDIFRITKVWILFQQMNIVYDDNFVPATTFGVTERH